jgi:hypothetical protein
LRQGIHIGECELIAGKVGGEGDSLSAMSVTR